MGGAGHSEAALRCYAAAMQAMKILALVLIVAGVLALAYGGFSYTSETHEANLLGLEFAVAEKERVNVPVWVGVALIVAGVVALLVPTKR